MIDTSRRGCPEAPLLRFLGGARTVTGSRFLIDDGTSRVLVDCGLFQGGKELRLRNWAPFPVPADTVDAVLLTHAHLDHCGYIPRLVKEGFHGPVYATVDTTALARIVLTDSGRLQEEEASYANRHHYSKHHPALALYTEHDAERACTHFVNVDFGEELRVGSMVATWRPAGHVLGSATISVKVDRGPALLFSGDLGRDQHPLLVPPAPVGDGVDWIVTESTYGDRLHDADDGLHTLTKAINDTVERGGNVITPAFAVDRTEVVLHHLNDLTKAGAIPKIPIYVDSPMALAALSVYRTAQQRGSADLRPEASDIDGLFDHLKLVEVRDVEESKELDQLHFPSVIVSASGMATGGRVLHHLKTALPDSRNTVVIVGFQAEQTRGRLLIDGVRKVRMLGQDVPVRAHIVYLASLSTHADRGDLLRWLRSASTPPHGVCVVHGEREAGSSLRDAIVDDLGWMAIQPDHGMAIELAVPSVQSHDKVVALQQRHHGGAVTTSELPLSGEPTR